MATGKRLILITQHSFLTELPLPSTPLCQNLELAVINAQTWKVILTCPPLRREQRVDFTWDLPPATSRLTFSVNGTQIATINPGNTSTAVGPPWQPWRFLGHVVHL